jgi:hypothetical protein
VTAAEDDADPLLRRRAILEVPADGSTSKRGVQYWLSPCRVQEETSGSSPVAAMRHGATPVLRSAKARRPIGWSTAISYPAEEVSLRTGFLHPLEWSRSRPATARWLADRGSPTCPSIVNRIWQAYFGAGLVTTAEDLGTQGDVPSHPELLDWLAVELMDHNWSLKHIHRLIVTSATYQQSSAVTPELLARDPANMPAMYFITSIAPNMLP